MMTGSLPVAGVSKHFWESTYFRVATLMGAPLLQNVVRDSCGKWLAATFHVDVLTWDRQMVADWITIGVVAGVAGYMWLKTRISRKMIAGVLLVVAVYLGFSAGVSHWTTATAVRWIAAGLLALGGIALCVNRIWLGLSSKAPDMRPIAGTESLGPVVAAMVQKQVAG